MDHADRRQDKRYQVRIVAHILRGREPIAALTEDVGYRGLFLATDAPPEPRQLVQLRLALPAGQRTITANGMAVYVIPRGRASVRTPGVGLQFYALDREAQGAWSDFIRYVERHHPEALDRRVQYAPPEVTEPVRRSFERHPVDLELEVRSMNELYALHTRDVSKGGMFIVTDLALAPGTPLAIHVKHPELGTTFVVAAVVRRRGHAHGAAGLGVEFTDMDDAQRAAFEDFVRGSFEMEVPELVEVGDPRLM